MAARRKKANGSNSEARAETLKAQLAKMDSLDARREKLNAEYQTCRAAIKEAGYNVKAVMAARQYGQLGEEKREGWDDSYRAARDLLDLPLFAAAAPAGGEDLGEAAPAGTA